MKLINLTRRVLPKRLRRDPTPRQRERRRGLQGSKRSDPLLAPRGRFWIRNSHAHHGQKEAYPFGRGAFKFLWKFSKAAEFAHETSLTDNLKDTADWILRSRVSVSAGLTSIFSLKFGWGVEYDNRPTPGFKKTDTIASAALVAKF